MYLKETLVNSKWWYQYFTDLNYHQWICVWACSHLGRFLARLIVQAAYPPALHKLVVSGVSLHLLPLVCGAVAGFQTGLLHWGFVLRWSFNGLHLFHILICLELSPKNNGNKQTERFLWLQVSINLTIIFSINWISLDLGLLFSWLKMKKKCIKYFLNTLILWKMEPENVELRSNRLSK